MFNWANTTSGCNSRASPGCLSPSLSQQRQGEARKCVKQISVPCWQTRNIIMAPALPAHSSFTLTQYIILIPSSISFHKLIPHIISLASCCTFTPYINPLLTLYWSYPLFHSKDSAHTIQVWPQPAHSPLTLTHDSPYIDPIHYFSINASHILKVSSHPGHSPLTVHSSFTCIIFSFYLSISFHII